MKVREILSSKGLQVITIHPQQSIMEAVTLLVQHNIGALVVTDENELPVGMLSERDIIRRAANDEQVFERQVSELMTPDVITGVPQDDTFSVAATMTKKRFRHLPIMQDGKLMGIVSIGDILKAERDRYRGEIDTLETQLMAEDE